MSLAHAASRPLGGVSSFLRRVRWLRLVRALACVLAFLLVPLLVGAANFGAKAAGAAPAPGRPDYTGTFPAPTYDPAKRIAVIVAGSEGAEITDTLPTFEILARSGAFNVYIVAPERTVLRFLNSGPSTDTGLDFVPHFSYAGYATAISKAPDLIVVPALTGSQDAVVDWVRTNTGPQTTVLGICVGSAILADTGLLDGHAATQNPLWFARVAASHPAVRLVRDVRYVDDGPVITSTSVAAGIDATLHTVARLVSRPVAVDVARQVGYTHTGYLDDPRFQYPALSQALVQVGANATFEWPQEQMGILLYDGVSEFALGGLLDAYTASLAARASVFAPERAPILSRDGLVFLPRYAFGTVPALDRVVLPGGDPTASRQQAITGWERLHPDRPVQDIHRNIGPGESAYDATLQDLAQRHNGMVAAAIARTMFVPTGHLAGAAWPVEPIGLPLVLGLLGAGLVYLIGRVPLLRRIPVRTYALSHN
jgi:transcriptional regulator GlxA family with amidase domain